jgi:hypothetical protein
MIRFRFVQLSIPVAGPIIEWYTGHWASHVDAEDGSGRILGAKPFLGVATRDKKDIPSQRVEHIDVPCTEAQMIAFWTFLNNEKGKRYDWLGLLCFPLRSHSNRRWFCSELLVAAIAKAGIHKFERPFHYYSPAELYEILKIKNQI